jgi:IS30 family transposase
MTAASYSCKPYHGWVKSGAEKFNGLVTQYFPQGCDLRKDSPALPCL